MNDINLPRPPNGWNHYEALVMETLEHHGRRLDGIDDKLTNIRVDIATLKGKAATWGAVSGAIFGGLIAMIAGLIVHGLSQ